MVIGAVETDDQLFAEVPITTAVATVNAAMIAATPRINTPIRAFERKLSLGRFRENENHARTTFIGAVAVRRLSIPKPAGQRSDASYRATTREREKVLKAAVPLAGEWAEEAALP